MAFSSWLEVLQKALSTPVGLALLCESAENADKAKRQLYTARAKARDSGNNSFDSLSISISPHANEILYLYKTKEPDDAESPGTPSEGISHPSI